MNDNDWPSTVLIILGLFSTTEECRNLQSLRLILTITIETITKTNRVRWHDIRLCEQYWKYCRLSGATFGGRNR